MLVRYLWPPAIPAACVAQLGPYALRRCSLPSALCPQAASTYVNSVVRLCPHVALSHKEGEAVWSQQVCFAGASRFHGPASLAICCAPCVAHNSFSLMVRLPTSSLLHSISCASSRSPRADSEFIFANARGWHELEAKNKILEAGAGQYEAQIKALKRRIDELAKAANDQAEEASKFHAQSEELRRQLDEARVAQAGHEAELRRAREEARAALADQAMDLEASRAEKQGLEGELHAARLAHLRLVEEHKKRAAELKACQDRLRKMEAELVDQRRQAAAGGAWAEQVAQLKEQLRAAGAANKLLQKEQAGADARHAAELQRLEAALAAALAAQAAGEGVLEQALATARGETDREIATLKRRWRS